MRRSNLGHRSARNRGFNQHIVGAADHDQMLDIVSSYEHELALPVEIENIDYGEPRRPPAPACHGDPPPEQNPAQQHNEQRDDDECNDHQ